MLLRNFSINAKLNVLLAVAAGVALCVSVVAFVANDVRIIRSAKISNLTAIADLVGTASVDALVRDDVFTATELLSALRLQTTVTYACLYDARGKMVAEFRSNEALDYRPPPPRVSGYDFKARHHLDVFDEIMSGDRVVGTIHLHANTNDLYVQFKQYVHIVTMILIMSLSASLLLSMRLRKLISEPILRLAETAQRISSSGDHSIRVHRQDRDEIGTLYDQFNAMLDQIERGERELQEAHALLEQRVRDRTAELTQANFDLTREMADRKSAERELALLNEQLVDAARRAGMAEIATGVLHNVGNVLNSVNVSCTLVADRLRKAKFADLERIVDLLATNSGNLGEFLTEDEQGKQVLGFLNLLARHLSGEQSFLLREVASLTKNIDHIKSIVAMQQSYAGISGVIEPVSISELLDRAIALNESAFERRGIEVTRDYEELPEIRTDHQKLLQIVVNLLQNARDALIDSEQANPHLSVRLYRTGDDQVRIEVTDNGLGIAAENLSRIFSHGFTTKHSGHGFGLHSCANAAAEMGGSLSAKSAGHGRGATFILELPYQPVELAV